MHSIKILFLAFLQGIAEFLPISSSGHLAAAKNWLGITTEGLALELLLHIGTLLAVIFFYRRRIAFLVLGLISRTGATRRAVFSLFAGCIPAVLAYLLFDDTIERCFDKGVSFSGAMLILTGFILLSTRLRKEGRIEDVGLKYALLIGIAQATALLPGISRSGMTISTARHLGIKWKESVDFSFLMSIILMAGATFVPLVKEGNSEFSNIDPTTAVAAIAISAITGYWALRLLIGILASRYFWLFGTYCIIVGIAAIAFC